MPTESWSRFVMRRRCRRSLALALLLLGGAVWLLWACWPRIVVGGVFLKGIGCGRLCPGQTYFPKRDLRQRLAEALDRAHPIISRMVSGDRDYGLWLRALPDGIDYGYQIPGYSARYVTCDLQNGIVFHRGSGGPYGAEVDRLNDELLSIVAEVASEAVAEIGASSAVEAPAAE